ncbi:hypothetical protein VB796_05330 [Arcicella sp. LKC2W]|uniref:energy transducer TonB n=1 Tax=Arcicella sp. LKC2W TaxID=2984198 RepID=UPI002B1F3D98|nr:hypothetical protein [Arcicella sp. LKC2W]MEA5458448.1 hypothetical protein [Arcicella sp. LKC2W]
MKNALTILRVYFMVLLLTNCVFSQRNDTITIIDAKSIMEPFLNKNPDTIAYMFSEKAATFLGGRDSLNAYVKRFLQRKSIKIDKNKTMILTCIFIEKDGCVSEVQLLTHSNNPALDEGLINAILLSPRWSSATQDDKKVRFKMFLPFNFP